LASLGNLKTPSLVYRKALAIRHELTDGALQSWQCPSSDRRLRKWNLAFNEALSISAQLSRRLITILRRCPQGFGRARCSHGKPESCIEQDSGTCRSTLLPLFDHASAAEFFQKHGSHFEYRWPIMKRLSKSPLHHPHWHPRIRKKGSSYNSRTRELATINFGTMIPRNLKRVHEDIIVLVDPKGFFATDAALLPGRSNFNIPSQ